MREKIECYFESLEPSQLGLRDSISVLKIEKLGQGTSNINYLVCANNSKFVLRINADPKSEGKSRREFEGLSAIQDLGIAPVPRIFSEDKSIFGAEFLLVDYIEGVTVDKSDIYLKDAMIKGVARLLAKVHSIRIEPSMRKVLKVNLHNSETISGKVLDYYLKNLRKNIEDERFFEMIDDSLERTKTALKNYVSSDELCLSQGDFCEQNVIYNNGKFSLIDFEDIELTDPISQIANVIIDFGKPFDIAQRKLFFREYSKIKKIDDLERKVECFIPILYLVIFLWSAQHALRVKNKEFGKEFLKENDINKNLRYVGIMFRRNIKAGVIDNRFSDLDIGKVLGF